MADNRKPSEAEAFKLQFDRLMGQVRVCYPGKITSFDASTQTVSAVPGVKMKTNIDGVVNFVDLPEIKKIPLVLPYGQSAGFLLTVPIQAGDDCLLLFADRDIDNFINSGQISIPGQAIEQSTTTPRAHHLTDAVCIPGFICTPKAVSEYSTEAIEIRDKERKSYISLSSEGIEISDGVATWKMSGGNIDVMAIGETVLLSGAKSITAATITETALTAYTITAPTINIAGIITVPTLFVTASLSAKSATVDDTIILEKHTHGGVQTGGGNTGGPQ